MNRFPYEPEDDSVEIVNEDVIEFQFTNFVIQYNKTQGIWLALYYADGDEKIDLILDRDSIPPEVDMTPEEFDILQEALDELLKENADDKT